MLWDKKLETGVGQIDAQHQELFRRIDILLDVKNKDRIPETLGFLGEYILKHFHDEEALHRQAGYPKAAQHKGYHDSYVRSFRQLQAQYAKEGENLSISLAVNRNVVDWLTSHILVHDREFADFYRGKAGK